MKKSFSSKLNRNLVELFAGDYFATGDQSLVFSTLLGSCIAVCMKDKISGVVGMNHFMLPRWPKEPNIVFSADARYGINAMEMMINDMMKLGAKREHLQAKVFGGGQVLGSNLTNVAQSNIEFIQAYLHLEEVPIVAQDMGGSAGRKLYFFSDTFTVYVKKIQQNQILDSAVKREKRFLAWMRKQSDKEGELTIFNK